MTSDTIHSISPAVFVFDPVTGDVVSLNNGAVQLVERFDLAAASRLTLAAIERSIVAGAKTKSHPMSTQGLAEGASELRRICRRPEGSVLALSRIWAPGSSTMLVIEDMTAAEQERRRARVWRMIAAGMARLDGATAKLDRALRAFCLLSRSTGGEMWVAEGNGFVRRAVRTSSVAVSAPRMKSADDSIVGQAWAKGETIRAGNRVAVPMFAGTALAAILVLDVAPAFAGAGVALSLIESLASLFGMALVAIRQGEELSTMKSAALRASDGEGARSGRAAARAKNVHVVSSLRAAG
jgi:hypothetical protein